MPFTMAPRLRGFAYQGPYRYFVTICVDDRRRELTTSTRIEPVASQLLTVSASQGFAVVAYCFMPDHMHVLLEASVDGANLKEWVRLFKQRSAFAWKRANGGGLWQRGYYDRVLREDEDAIAVARYILNNPVRAGLVACPMDYPFSGSGTMEVKDLIATLD